MKSCIYIAALLALVGCEPNQKPSLRNRDTHTYLRKKLNVFKPQQNQQTSTKSGTHKIIGGKFVMDIEEYPFMALLLRSIIWYGKIWNGQCGATILNKKYLLSAAHCFQSPKPNSDRYPTNEFTVYVGGLSMERSLDRAKVKQYFIHPLNEFYKDDKTFICNFDVAVIELDKELYFSSKISSVKLPPPLTTSGLNSRLPKICIHLGIGEISLHFKFNPKIYLLKKSEVEMVNPNNTTAWDCQQITKICNIDLTHNENSACFGDSGGPLMCDGVQVGIVSYGPKYCAPNEITVNARVEYFVDWINTFIKDN